MKLQLLFLLLFSAPLLVRFAASDSTSNSDQTAVYSNNNVTSTAKPDQPADHAANHANCPRAIPRPAATPRRVPVRTTPSVPAALPSSTQ